MNEKLFYTPKEFSLILRCTTYTCYQALHEHKIRNFKLGSKYFIPASEVDRLSQLAAAEHNEAPKADPDLW